MPARALARARRPMRPRVRSVHDHGPGVLDDFVLPVDNGKLFVPFEVGEHTLSLGLDAAAAAAKSLELSHCELTRAR